MLVIRLFRVGKKNQPFFKVVITDKRSKPKAGRFVEEVGFYNPLTKEKNLKTERIRYWLAKGAKPSETIYNLLVSEKIVEGKKIPLHKKSKKPVEAVPPTSTQGVKADKSTGEEKPTEEKSKEEPAPVSAEAAETAPAEQPVAERKPVPPETPTEPAEPETKSENSTPGVE